MSDRKRILTPELCDMAGRIAGRCASGSFGSSPTAKADVAALGNAFVKLVKRIEEFEGTPPVPEGRPAGEPAKAETEPEPESEKKKPGLFGGVAESKKG